jgi:hypothetical protein
MDFLDNDPVRMFTRLHARVTQEEDGFRVSVRMHNHLRDEDKAWGVETASSIEMASGLIGRLAEHFSIQQSGISITFVMHNYRESTLH